MKFSLAAAACVLLGRSASAAVSAQNPLAKVVDLLSELEAKVIKEGEAEVKAFEEYTEWCDDASKNAKFAVEDATKQQGKLEAKIAELTSDSQVADAKIEELAAAISTSEADLAKAADVRGKESSEFGAAEKELMESLDILARAISVLEKEMAKSPSLAQVDMSALTGTLQALSTVLDAASFSTNDKDKLQSLLQASSDDDEPGAPAAAMYKTHSTNIVDVLEDMKEKAEEQLGDLRKTEVDAKHNYEMLRSSLEAQKSADTKDLGQEKDSKTSAEEHKASAQGDLQITVEALATSTKDLQTSQTTCMTVAADHEATVASRTEELKVIAEAKKVLKETSDGAVSQTYSFLQLKSKFASHNKLAQLEVVSSLQSLAKKHHSAALAQLASRVAAVVKYSRAGEDPFTKVKGLINDLVAKLEKEAESEATEKAYCDEEMSKTAAKTDELKAELSKLTSKLDQASAKSAELKEEVRVLEAELAELAKEQAQMDQIRTETHADYAVAKEDLSLGLKGVRSALRALREYYGGAAEEEASALVQQPAMPEKHTKAGGAGTSIVGLLEVVESDFATNLAKEEQQEADAQNNYEKVTQENKISKGLKEQDVKYKTKEAAALDNSAAELSSDRDSTSTELEAVLEYDSKLKARCIAKPETYEERSARRTSEIEGLKQALSVLSEETALVQRKSVRGNMRGTLMARE